MYECCEDDAQDIATPSTNTQIGISSYDMNEKFVRRIWVVDQAIHTIYSECIKISYDGRKKEVTRIPHQASQKCERHVFLHISGKEIKIVFHILQTGESNSYDTYHIDTSCDRTKPVTVSMKKEPRKCQEAYINPKCDINICLSDLRQDKPQSSQGYKSYDDDTSKSFEK